MYSYICICACMLNIYMHIRIYVDLCKNVCTIVFIQSCAYMYIYMYVDYVCISLRVNVTCLHILYYDSAIYFKYCVFVRCVHAVFVTFIPAHRIVSVFLNQWVVSHRSYLTVSLMGCRSQKCRLIGLLIND
jgi:hypothetical protein